MKIQKVKWPNPYPGAYWLDEREERAVLDVLHRRALFRYYGLKKPKYVRLERTARDFYGSVRPGRQQRHRGALYRDDGPGHRARLRGHPAGLLLGRHGGRGGQGQRHPGAVRGGRQLSAWIRRIWRARSRRAPS